MNSAVPPNSSDAGSAPGSAPRRRGWIAGGIAAVLLLVAASVIVIVAMGNASAASVTLIPSATRGPNPFTNSVAKGATPATDPTVARKSAQLRTTLPVARNTKTPVATGTTPGLYGGSGNTHVCDPQQLVKFLQANPKKAAAWAHVLGIAAADIPKYVAALTPVLLNSDTLVGNHGYHKGSATSLLSVLQAGTAVMVDATGTPRVKCNCGNPLTPPQLIAVPSAHITGPAWPGYAPTGVIAVQPGKAAHSLTLVDVGTGAVYAQPVGTGSGEWVAAALTSSSGNSIVDQTTIETSAAGTVWSPVGVIPDELVTGLTWGGDRWIAVADPIQTEASQSDIFSSSDLHTWIRVATVSGHLTGVAFGDGRWVAVGSPDPEIATNGQTLYAHVGYIYTSTDTSTWTLTTITDYIKSYYLEGFLSVGFHDGKWIALAGSIQKSPLITFESQNGIDWTTQNDDSITGVSNGHLAPGDSAWLIASNRTGSQPGGATSLSPDGIRWATGYRRFRTGLDRIRRVWRRALDCHDLDRGIPQSAECRHQLIRHVEH